MAIASAPGKTILFGEHAVVYGRTGIAAAVGVKSTVAANVGSAEICNSCFGKVNYSATELENLLHKIDGFAAKKDFGEMKSVSAKDMPMKYILAKIFNRFGFQPLKIVVESEVRKGLGSSSSVFSALALAACKALGRDASKRDVSALAYDGDVVAHGGMPSGIDNSTVTFGGYVKFKKSDGATPLRMNFEMPLLIVDSGAPATTAEMVARVRMMREQKTAFVDQLLDAIDSISTSAIDALGCGDVELLGKLMNENHELLRKLGVSTAELDSMVATALKNGAIGAKLTGGGGGGCMIVLMDDQRQMGRLESAFASRGYETIKTKIGVEGVKLEK